MEDESGQLEARDGARGAIRASAATQSSANAEAIQTQTPRMAPYGGRHTGFRTSPRAPMLLIRLALVLCALALGARAQSAFDISVYEGTESSDFYSCAAQQGIGYFIVQAVDSGK
jgi:hypothetical protein